LEARGVVRSKFEHSLQAISRMSPWEANYGRW